MHETYGSYLEHWKKKIVVYYNEVSDKFDFYERFNAYFYRYRRKILRRIIPPHKKILDIGCGGGDNLANLTPSRGLGLDISSHMVHLAKSRHPELEFICKDIDTYSPEEGDWEYLLAINLLLEVPDINLTLNRIHHIMSEETRLVILNHSANWEFLFRIYTFFQKWNKRINQNWLNRRDYENLFNNCGFQVIKKTKALLVPINIPILSNIINWLFHQIPFIRRFGLLDIYTLKKRIPRERLPDFSVSVIVPCKNESENIPAIIPRMPGMGRFTEIVFVDDLSTDDTHKCMQEQKEKFPDVPVKIVDGSGLGKGAACRKGFEAATGDILMILDADLTVPPEVLPDFFEIIQAGHAEFVNGSRQVYQLEEDSMRMANCIGNGFFAYLFSFLMGFRVNDTLCGTKVFFRKHYPLILESREFFATNDVWGDFDLLFAASRHNLMYTEHPVHYFPRTYGETKMGRRLHNAQIMFRNWYNAWVKSTY